MHHSRHPAKPGRTTTERGEERRTQVLRTALHLFADRGVDGVGLREIAEKVGIAQPALYHYFASKDALVEMIIEWRLRANEARMSRTALEVNQPTSLRQGLLDYLQHFHASFRDPDNDAIHRLMLGELARHTRVAVRFRKAFVQPQVDRLARLFAGLAAAGKIRDLDPHALAVQFLGPMLLSGFLGAADAGRPSLLQGLVFQHLEVFIRGVEQA
jgi:AcrR family transcriptional regulator